MEHEQEVQQVIMTLKELINDDSIPRNIKSKFQEMITILQQHDTLSIRINKVLSAMDEIADDTNIQPYTRTQIWGITSMLESIDTSN